MNNIDILEDLLSTQKQYIEDKDYQKEHNIKEQAIDYAKMWTKATETLIAENKELKEEKKKTIVMGGAEYISKFIVKENYIPKSKLKAKIEEVEQWDLYNMKIPKLSTLDERLGAKIGIKYVLQSLLGKE